MRFIYGAVAVFLWVSWETYMASKGVEISNDMQLLTMAIAFAGAMAGGD